MPLALPRPAPRLFGSHSLAPRPPYSSSRPLEADRLHERRAQPMLAFFTLFFFPSFFSFLELGDQGGLDGLRVGAVMRPINGKGTSSLAWFHVRCLLRARTWLDCRGIFEAEERRAGWSVERLRVGRGSDETERNFSTVHDLWFLSFCVYL